MAKLLVYEDFDGFEYSEDGALTALFDVDLFGPAVPVGDAQPKYWNGSQWVNGTLRVWTGSAWVVPTTVVF